MEKSNMFFKQLSELLPDGVDLNLTVRKKDDEITMVITPQSTSSKVIPMSIKGTADELDKEFFKTIGEMLKGTKGLIVQTKQYEERLKKKTKEMEDKLAEKKVENKPKTNSSKDDDEDESKESLFETENKEKEDDDD